MHIGFRKWLEEAGESFNKTNTSQDNGFSYLKSKYMSGTRTEKPTNLNPDKAFGIKNNKKYLKK